MVIPEGQPISQEASAEQYPLEHKEFLSTVYERLVENWKSERNALVINKFEDILAENWDHHEKHPGSVLSFQAKIIQGVIMKNEKFDFGVALVECAKTGYDRGDTLRLQFGGMPHSNAPAIRELSPIRKLKMLVDQPLEGSGELYSHDLLNKITVDCWADERMFGGKDIRRRSQEFIMSEEGIIELVNMAGRAIDRSFH